MKWSKFQQLPVSNHYDRYPALPHLIPPPCPSLSPVPVRLAIKTHSMRTHIAHTHSYIAHTACVHVYSTHTHAHIHAHTHHTYSTHSMRTRRCWRKSLHRTRDTLAYFTLSTCLSHLPCACILAVCIERGAAGRLGSLPLSPPAAGTFLN